MSLSLFITSCEISSFLLFHPLPLEWVSASVKVIVAQWCHELNQPIRGSQIYPHWATCMYLIFIYTWNRFFKLILKSLNHYSTKVKTGLIFIIYFNKVSVMYTHTHAKTHTKSRSPSPLQSIHYYLCKLPKLFNGRCWLIVFPLSNITATHIAAGRCCAHYGCGLIIINH